MLGDDALKVYNSFHFSTPEQQQTCQEILEVFDKQAVDESNVTYEHFVFHMRRVWEHRSFYNWFADTNKNMCLLWQLCGIDNYMTELFWVYKTPKHKNC